MILAFGGAKFKDVLMFCRNAAAGRRSLNIDKLKKCFGILSSCKKIISVFFFNNLIEDVLAIQPNSSARPL